MRYWWPVLSWMCLLVLISAVPTQAAINDEQWAAILRLFVDDVSIRTVLWAKTILRKSVHLAAYFILGLLLFRGFRGNATPRWDAKWAWASGISTAIFGGLDEFSQLFSPDRHATWFDVGVNLSGAALAQVWLWRWCKGSQRGDEGN